LRRIQLDDQEIEFLNALIDDAASVVDAASLGVGPTGGDEA